MSTRSSTPRLWSNHDWTRLFLAQITSLVGSGVTSVALAAFAYQLTGEHATVVVGTALMLRIAAFLIFSQPAGILADRVNRQNMLVAADLVRVALLGIFPFVDQIWQIYTLIFLINAVTAFFTPAFEATIPDLVGPQLYTRAVSLSRIATDLEAALGPLLAGLLIATVGVRFTFWFDSLTYVASALLVLRSRVPQTLATKTAVRVRDLFQELTHGTRVILREPDLRRALVMHAAEAVAGAVAIVTTVVYVRDVLQRGNVSFAISMAVLGAGSSLAALLLSRLWPAPGAQGVERDAHLLHRWARRSLGAGGLALTCALLPGILQPAFGFLLALWALNGAGQALIAIPSVALLAEHSSPDERGRAYAAHFAWTHLFWLISYPVTGLAARSLGTPRTFTLAGVLCGALALIAALLPAQHREHQLPGT